jgi:hypothetical protein
MFLLVASIIYLIREIYVFVQHIILVQRYSDRPVVGIDGSPLPQKYRISLMRQFGILFTLSYIITFILS